MVRTIDGPARRHELAEAVRRIVLRDGLAAASVRSVARETGLSAGSVRHFFATQRELISFAMRELVEAVRDRIDQAEREIADPEERALAMLAELVPFTDTTQAEAFAWLQFVSQARFDPALADIARPSFDGIRRTCVRVVELLREAGRLPVGTDVPAVAATLCALVDGVTLELLFAPHLLSVGEARDLVRDFLRTAATTSGGHP